MFRTKYYDVVVVGAGVFGSWTAWHLADQGRKVLLVDAHGPAHSRASSGGESRIIRMAYGPDELTCGGHSSHCGSGRNFSQPRANLYLNKRVCCGWGQILRGCSNQQAC